MKDEQKKIVVKDSVVTFCGDSGCCPTATFSEDGTVVFRGDDGQEIVFTKSQYEAMEQFVLTNHGFV